MFLDNNESLGLFQRVLGSFSNSTVALKDQIR